VFEAGFFMSMRGKERTLVIREQGAKMPADLGGIIYASLEDRDKISAIDTILREFLEGRL
jgi:predicted nucleotide-binding protein